MEETNISAEETCSTRKHCLIIDRLPIEDEPCVCEQEAAESIVMAECMNGMVQSANLPEAIMDVDRTALLGGKLAERACGVNKGDRMECEPQSQLQQMEFYCKESRQRNRIANRDLSSTLRLPLVGEWLVCASGETSNSNAVELEACKGGVSEYMSVDEADGDPGQGVEPTDVPDKSDTLVTVLIKPDATDSGEIPCVCLG